MPFLQKYQKIIEKKWFYFGLGIFITLLLVGSVSYIAQNVKGESLIRSTNEVREDYPSLIADGRGHIYGGLTTNQMHAESGLIVLGGLYKDPNTGQDVLKGKVGIGFGSGEVPQSMLDVKGDVKIDVSGTNSTSGLIVLGGTRYGGKSYGRVGIGFPGGEIPSEMLEVRGNIKVVDRDDTDYVEKIIAPEADIPRIVNPTVQISDRLSLNSDGINHLEDRPAGTYSYWAYGNCHCLGARKNESRLADAHKFSLSGFGRALKQYIGSLILPSAWAVGQCYTSRSDCINAGGSYCEDYGDSCVPGQYDFAINCTSDPTADAQCDPGDSPIAGTEQTYSCWGTEYIGKRECQSSGGGGLDWYSKIRFSGSPAVGEPSQTIIDDDLVADNNVPSNCGWYDNASYTECPDGEFMAGYDGSRIKCCEL